MQYSLKLRKLESNFTWNDGGPTAVIQKAYQWKSQCRFVTVSVTTPLATVAGVCFQVVLHNEEGAIRGRDSAAPAPRLAWSRIKRAVGCGFWDGRRAPGRNAQTALIEPEGVCGQYALGGEC